MDGQSEIKDTATASYAKHFSLNHCGLGPWELTDNVLSPEWIGSRGFREILLGAVDLSWVP